MLSLKGVTEDFTENFGGQAQHVEVVSKHARDVHPEEREDRQIPENAAASEHSGESESAASGPESGASPEAEQRQSGEKVQPDAGTADLDEAEDFTPEPNVLIYSLSAAGDSVQQALSALAKQVNLQAWSYAKTPSTVTCVVAETETFPFAETIKSGAVLCCYHNTPLLGTYPALIWSTEPSCAACSAVSHRQQHTKHRPCSGCDWQF